MRLQASNSLEQDIVLTDAHKEPMMLMARDTGEQCITMLQVAAQEVNLRLSWQSYYLIFESKGDRSLPLTSCPHTAKLA